MKLLICPSPDPVSSTALHLNFDTHLICLNKGLPILNSKVCMTSNKLKVALAIKLLKEGSSSGYPMIIAKVFESMFEGVEGDVKLKVSNN